MQFKLCCAARVVRYMACAHNMSGENNQTRHHATAILISTQPGTTHNPLPPWKGTNSAASTGSMCICMRLLTTRQAVGMHSCHLCTCCHRHLRQWCTPQWSGFVHVNMVSSTLFCIVGAAAVNTTMSQLVLPSAVWLLSKVWPVPMKFTLLSTIASAARQVPVTPPLRSLYMPLSPVTVTLDALLFCTHEDVLINSTADATPQGGGHAV
jgi:hypothetical protein